MPNQWYQLVSPNKKGSVLWIHQDAWFYLGKFDVSSENSYLLKKKTSGLYVFVIEGAVKIEGMFLNKRDGLGIWDTEKVDFRMEHSSKLLLMEIPM